MKSELQAISYKLQGTKMAASSPRRAVFRAAGVEDAAPALFNWLKDSRALRPGACGLRLLAVSAALLLSAQLPDHGKTAGGQ